MADLTDQTNTTPADGGQTPATPPLNLQAVLADPASKAILDQYAAEQARPLRTALDEHKAFKARYVAGEENGQVKYLDPEAAQKALAAINKSQNKTKHINDNEPGTGITDEDLSRALESNAQSLRQKEVEPLKQVNQKLTATIQNLLIDNQLNVAFDSIQDGAQRTQVKPVLKDAALKLLRDRFNVIEDNGGHIVVIHDDSGNVKMGANGRMTINEFVNEWAQTEQGKAFVLAPQSGGGNTGAQPANQSSSAFVVDGKTIKTKADFGKNQVLKAHFVAEYGQEAFAAIPLK